MTGATHWIEPQWPVSAAVRAAFTLRGGGCSQPPYASWNLAAHVGDQPAAVRRNRQRLRQALSLPAEPAWLEQVHGTQLLAAHDVSGVPRADASWTDRDDTVCAVMVADCLPVLLAAEDASVVAAVHAGWRGLAQGVVTTSLRRLQQHRPGVPLHAWLGPCIGPAAFEVGPEVRQAFVGRDIRLSRAFAPGSGQRCHADLQLLARIELEQLGIASVTTCTACSFSDSDRFFSYRRDGRTGRMAALIWRQRRG